jgi:hypothetical protein
MISQLHFGRDPSVAGQIRLQGPSSESDWVGMARAADPSVWC